LPAKNLKRCTSMANDNMEKNRKKRKTSKSDEVGSKKPSVEEVASFVSFRLDGRLLKAVSNQFGKPTLVQAAAIPLALNGRDIVARAKTGSGKTLAYVIPIIHQILAKLVCQNFLDSSNFRSKMFRGTGRLPLCSSLRKSWQNRLLKFSIL